MAKMRVVRRTKDGVVLSAKTGLPKVTTTATAAKVARVGTPGKEAATTSYIDGNGIKITMCRPSPAPKLRTAGRP